MVISWLKYPRFPLTSSKDKWKIRKKSSRVLKKYPKNIIINIIKSYLGPIKYHINRRDIKN